MTLPLPPPFYGAYSLSTHFVHPFGRVLQFLTRGYPNSSFLTFLLVSVALVTGAEVGWGQDIYISDQGSQESWNTGRIFGKGTSDAPYFGDFDAIFAKKVAPNSTVRLTGSFFTRGSHIGKNHQLKAGVKLIGSGKYSTTITLQMAEPQRGDVIVLAGEPSAAQILVSDLTVDATAAGHAQTNHISKRNGVNLFGDSCTIRNVRAIRCFGRTTGDRECFAIKIFDGRNALIEGCEVSQVKGNACSAFGLNHGELRNNVAIFDPEYYEPPHVMTFWFGLNCEYADGVWVHHNQVFNGSVGYYVDTGISRGLRVTDNQFNSVQRGVVFNMSCEVQRVMPLRGVDRATISDNRIYLSPTAQNVYGILLDHTTIPYNSCNSTQNFIQHVVITRNEIAFPPGVVPQKREGHTKWALVVASDRPYQAFFADRPPIGITDVLFTDNVVQPQPPGTGELRFRNKVLKACTGRDTPNATNVRGWRKSPLGGGGDPITCLLYTSPSPRD